MEYRLSKFKNNIANQFGHNVFYNNVLIRVIYYLLEKRINTRILFLMTTYRRVLYGNIHWYGAVKTHIIACGVIKTTPNNYTSHVGCDTSAEVCNTGAVDLENWYWNSMEPKSPSIPSFHLLWGADMGTARVMNCGHAHCICGARIWMGGRKQSETEQFQVSWTDHTQTTHQNWKL